MVKRFYSSSAISVVIFLTIKHMITIGRPISIYAWSLFHNQCTGVIPSKHLLNVNINTV